MAMTNEFLNQDAVTLNTMHPREAGAFVLRLAQMIFGASLIMAAAVLWLAPGINWSSDIILIKAVLSVTAVVIGTAVLHAGRKVETTEVEIDTVRRELRVISVQGNKRDETSKTSFSDLYKAEQDGTVVRLWKDANTLLTEVSGLDRRAISGLVSGLRDAGKLC